MNETKPLLQSITIRSLLVALITWTLGKLGYAIEPGAAQNILEWISTLITPVAMIIALIGRIRAKHTITIGDVPTPPTTNYPRNFALLLAALLILTMTSGCELLGAGSVDEQYRDADRATYEAVAPATADLLDGKRTPADFDADERQSLHDTLDTWRLRVDAAEDDTTQP